MLCASALSSLLSFLREPYAPQLVLAVLVFFSRFQFGCSIFHNSIAPRTSGGPGVFNSSSEIT